MAMEYEVLANILQVAVMKVADDCMKTNAENAQNVGLEVTVTRRYDGVGLDGGRVCQWCLDRCGENVPYQEAVSQGMFERHPGCGCELDYITERGIQRQTDWKTNTWSDFQSPAAIEQRKKTGIAIVGGRRSSGNQRNRILKQLAQLGLASAQS